MERYKIKKRNISDAIYSLKNPNGDPFEVRVLKTRAEFLLFGLGLGLYWGEGNKRNMNSVRVTNTDPGVINIFVSFLKKIYKVKEDKIKYGLQLFDDSNPKKSLLFWQQVLNVDESKFYKVVISKVRGSGTYKNKSENGVITVYFNNSKLRNILVAEIEKLRKM